jgi:NADPH:quinone reductase-like Zn-dependent oxidoreductase
MRAVKYENYGPAEVLQFVDLPKPTPADDEILIRVYATSVTAGDWRLRIARPFIARTFNGLRRPRKIQVLGFEVAGVIEKVGKNVTRFKTGDAVFASCGVSFGGYAEYKILPEDGVIAHKPANLTFEEAAVVPIGGGTALRFLKRANIQPGQKVMIYGASGSVGTYAVQLAKHMGTEVTGVCSTANLDMVKSIGADHVIDYTSEDYTTETGQYDVVFETVGKGNMGGLLGLLKPNGVYLGASEIGLERVLRGMFNNLFKSGRWIASADDESAADLEKLSELLENNMIKPVIDRNYCLDEIVEAHRYMDKGRKKGNISITVHSLTTWSVYL